MLPLRRAALRALSARATPAPLLSSCTRAFVTSPSSQLFRPQQQWQLSRLQKRFASDEVKASDGPKASETGSPSEAEQLAAADVAAEAASTSAEGSSAVADAAVSSQQPATEAAVPEAVAEAEGILESASSSSPSAPAVTSAAGAAAAAAAPAARTPDTRTLYLGNLFYEVTEEDLKDFCESAGPVEDVRIACDQRGLSKGFAFVTFKSQADADKAVGTLNDQIFQGRRLIATPRRPREQSAPRRNDRNTATRRPSTPSKTLYIGNMSFEMSDKDLNDLFRDVRNVIDVRVAIDRVSGQPRGFAHADFIDIPSAIKAKEQLSGKEIYGRVLRIDYSISAPRIGSSESARPE